MARSGVLINNAVRDVGTVNSADQGPLGETSRGLGMLVNVESEPGGGTWDLALNVQIKDILSGNYVTIGTAALDEVDGVGTYYLTVYPSAGADVDLPMPKFWRVEAVLTGTAVNNEVIEYSVSFQGLN